MRGKRGTRLLLRWPLAATVGGLLVLGVPAAGAQTPLPSLPVPQAVQDVAREPLPEPVEQVVQDSPAAPVYNGARDTVAGITGGGPTGGGGGDDGGGGNGGGSSGGGGGSGQTQTSTGTAGPSPAGPESSPADRSGGDRPTGGRSTRRGGGDSRGGRGAGGTAGGDGRGAGAAGGDGRGAGNADADARRRARNAASGQGDASGVSGAIGDFVEVIPGPILAALGLLAALALALNVRAGVVRRRARWLEREREQLLLDVGVLQRALLPPVPARLGGLEASVAYSPADGPGAGGDFYDAFELPDDRVGIIVGDVAGHGRQALAKTTSVRHTLAAYLRGGLSPRAALGTVGTLLSDAEDNVFTTVVLAVHDRTTGRLTYACAGHPPPIFRGPASHEPVSVLASPPLGVGVPTGQRQTSVTLPPGSVVCLFTDGLLEARKDEELLGRERLTGLVGDLGPEEPADALLRAVAQEADETPDDMAACVLRAAEGPAGRSQRLEELELWGDLAELASAERFLEACGLRGERLAAALADAGDALTAYGTALLRVTLGEGEPEVAVTPRPDAPVQPAPFEPPPLAAGEAL